MTKKLAWEEKCCLLFWNISFCSTDIEVFKICKWAKWWCHTLNQILIKYDEKGYLSQFLSEMVILCSKVQLDVLHNLSTIVLLPWPCLRFFELKITYILKSSWWGLETSELPWEQNVFLAVGVFSVELSFNGPFIYMM